MQDCQRLSVAALLALASITGACASSNNAKPRPFPMSSGAGENPTVQTSEPAPAIPAPTPRAAVPEDRSVIAMALSFRGTPYRNGGSDPSGFDCSRFIQYVFAQMGLALPREVHEQYKVGKKLDEDDLKPGDLVFFHTVSKGASHVGLMVGDDQFVHAPSSKGVVRVEHLSSSYWAPRFVGGRRVPAEPAVAARRRPSAEESTVAAATTGRSASRGSRAAD